LRDDDCAFDLLIQVHIDLFKIGLPLRDFLLQHLIESDALHPVMYFAMTVGTDGSNETRVVWTSIAQASDVMRLKVRDAVSRLEGCRSIAGLAYSICALKNVLADGSTAGVVVAPCFLWRECSSV
jgi:hypothetical protein